jgi:hypothetical protein
MSNNQAIDLLSTAVKGLLPGSVRVVGFCDEEGIRFFLAINNHWYTYTS